MTQRSRLRLSICLGLAALCGGVVQAAPPPALPGDSVYQLPLALTDQQGRQRPLQDYRGQPLLVSMFYTSCQFVCPMLVEAMRATQTRLQPVERSHLPILMVSFDPAHDSVAVLKHTAEQRELDPALWTLARVEPKDVRKLAAVLGIQYRALPNGEFNHTTVLVLLDAEGRIVAKSSQLSGADAVFQQRVRAVVRSAMP
jgi:protein SCO1/2